MTIPRFVNTLTSMFHKKEKPMTEEAEQLELDLPPEADEPEKEITKQEPTILSVCTLGQGSDSPELHVMFIPVDKRASDIRIVPLHNPVTPKQIADILLTLD